MFLFFSIFAVDVPAPCREISRASLDQELYRSIGLVQVTFKRIKLKKKEGGSFEAVEVNSIAVGTGFLVQPGVVVTAAHVVMPEKFSLDNAESSCYREVFEAENYAQFPDKVEFFPFFPYNANQDQYRIEYIEPAIGYSPQSVSENENDVRKIDEKQRKLSERLVVLDKWKEFLQSRNVQPEGREQPNHLALP